MISIAPGAAWDKHTFFCFVFCPVFPEFGEFLRGIDPMSGYVSNPGKPEETLCLF